VESHVHVWFKWLKPIIASWEGENMESLSFEEAFAQLEATAEALQNGQMPLEQALQYYEEGMKLARHCNELLQKAELRVQHLTRDAADVPIVQSLELE
jgi:exodeoxyribonuclease VII small subunit